ncbi:MAG TPA: SDR family oxidoreductase [Syntrophomonas sp.]|nr:SDR family oxidoreductase [Syntrophomonas sp.]
MGRFGSNDELKTALMFLAAPGSTYVTGISLIVDGGYYAQ